MKFSLYKNYQYFKKISLKDLVNDCVCELGMEIRIFQRVKMDLKKKNNPLYFCFDY
jgi:hypothetical protein